MEHLFNMAMVTGVLVLGIAAVIGAIFTIEDILYAREQERKKHGEE